MSKSTSTVIATILMLMITIAIAGLAYFYMSGTLTSITSHFVEIISFNKGAVLVRNIGTNPISKDSIRVLVEGEEASFKLDKDQIDAGGIATLTILDTYKYDGRNIMAIIPGVKFIGDFGKNLPEGAANWLFKVGKSG